MAERKARSSLADAKVKAMKYCAYQERCHKEVTNKLYEWGLYKSEADQVLMHLMELNFLNEERFAKAFAGGKFRIKQWGRRKIVYELKAKGINNNLIRIALEEIDDEAYLKTMRTLMEKKNKGISVQNMYIRKGKIADFLQQKGYEPEIIREELKRFFS